MIIKISKRKNMDLYKDKRTYLGNVYKNLKYDKKLLQALHTFRLSWMTKTDEYMEFLGSNLIGVHTVRFTKVDDSYLMEDILKVDDLEFSTKDFLKVKTVNPKFKIISNFIYQSLVYITHEFIKRNKDKKLVSDFIKEVFLIMQYRMFTSNYYKYFSFNVEVDLAVTVYEKLSYKFILKKVGSWGNLFEHRCDLIVNKKDNNYKRIVRFTEEDMDRTISDIQTKTRSTLLTVYSTLVEVKKQNDIIKSESATFIGGENNERQLKEKEVDVVTLINNITADKYNENNFIDTDLINIVASLFKILDKDIIYKFLVRTCDREIHDSIKFKIKKDKKFISKDNYDIILSEIMSINFQYLQRLNINVSNRDNIPTALIAIKNYWSSSKVRNEDMNIVKNYMSKVAFLATGRKTKWLLATLVLVFVTYTFLRAFKK